SRLTTLVVDKTGTLTEGKPQVTEARVLSGDERDVLGLAAALERGSEHPLAAALLAYCDEQGAASREISGFDSVTGRGVTARSVTTAGDGGGEGKTLLLGNARLMEENGVSLAAGREFGSRLEKDARTVVYLAVAGEL